MIAGLYLTDIAVGWTHVGVGPYLHTWSLSVEEHFYLLWPPVLMLVLRRHASFRSIAFGLGIAVLTVSVWRAASFHWSIATGTHRGLAFDTQADQLLVGCLLAVMLPSLRGWLDAHRRTVALVALIGTAVLLAYVAHPPAAISQSVGSGIYLVLALSAAVVLTYLVTGAPRGLARFLVWSPVVYIGRLSYAIYLWHFVVFHALTAAALGTSRPVAIAVRLAVTLGLSALSYHVVEKRFRRRRHGIDAARASEPAPAGAARGTVSV